MPIAEIVSSLMYPVSPRHLIALFDGCSKTKEITGWARISAILARYGRQSDFSFNDQYVHLIAKACLLNDKPGGSYYNVLIKDFISNAAHSVRNYSQAEYNSDKDKAIIGYLFRTGFSVVAASDPIDLMIGRQKILIDILSSLPGYEVYFKNRLMKRYGISLSDSWAVAAAIFSIAWTRPDKNVFEDTFLSTVPKGNIWSNALNSFLKMSALDSSQYLSTYQSSKKYTSGCPFRWNTEYNVLRDFPIVRISDSSWVVPSLQFLVNRAFIGYYFDALEDRADEIRANSPKKNPYDNELSNLFGAAFEIYVGKQLELCVSPDNLIKEPTYLTTRGKSEAKGPDWIDYSDPNLPIFFECKGRRTRLSAQCDGDWQAIMWEFEELCARKCLRQAATFLDEIDAKNPSLVRFHGIKDVIVVLVTLEPLPAHAQPFVRTLISAAASVSCQGSQALNRIKFVPIWIRELEMATEICAITGLSIGSLLSDYARYRDSAPAVDAATRQLSCEFELWIQAIVGYPFHKNRLCIAGFRKALDDAHFAMWGESLGDTEKRHLQSAAYFHWLERGCPENDALTDWLWANEQMKLGNAEIFE